jgi:hypothetical protein
MTEERSATIDINPAIPPGFLLQETGLRPFFSPSRRKPVFVKNIARETGRQEQRCRLPEF